MLDTVQNMPMSEIYSFIGLALITFAALPQAIKTLKTKETEAISLKMYLMYPAGCALMFMFGFETSSYSVMFWETIALLVALPITFTKIKNIRTKGESW